MQAQLSGLIVQNEALDSLVDAAQSAISGYALDSDTLVQSDISKTGTGIVIDTATIGLADTLKDSLLIAGNKAGIVPLSDSAATETDTITGHEKVFVSANEELNTQKSSNDTLINNLISDTTKTSNSLLTANGPKNISQPKDSLNNKSNAGQASNSLLSGNVVVVPAVDIAEKDTVANDLASIQKDTAAIQSQINVLEDSLASKAAVNKTSNGLLAATAPKNISEPKDSLTNKSNAAQASGGLSRGNAVVVAVTDNTKDSIKERSRKSNEEIAILQARVKTLEDSLNSKGLQETFKGNPAIVPVVNKRLSDTLPASNDDIAVLQKRINALEDSLSKNAAAGKSKNGLLTASGTDKVSQQPSDTTKHKANAAHVSNNMPNTSDNEEVSRLRAELSDLQKEKESLMQQLDNKTIAPVILPEENDPVSGNKNVATQEDVNALKSEIQSLKSTINANNNNRVGPQRSILPPIVPAIGIGVGKTKVETVVQHDTIFVEKPADGTSYSDTVRITDTFVVRDTVRVSDTVNQIVRDTVQQTIVKDSLVTVTNVVDKQKENLLALPPYVILFDLGKSDVKLVYRKRLDYYAVQLKKHKDLKVVITGHTDKTGSVANNLILSEKRAGSISDYLIGKGVSSSDMQLNGQGETNPIVENDTKEGQGQNRRVELIFKEK